MTANQIIRLIEDPAALNPESLSKLNQVLEDYPYFQTVRLLHLMNLRAIKDLCFSAELRKMAIYSGDRKKLFYLFEADKFAPLDVNVLEKPEKPILPEDSFSLINLFLSEKNALTDNNPVGMLEHKESLVLTNYISIMPLMTDTENKEENIKKSVPMPHQDVIDQFLSQDRELQVKMKLKNEDADLRESESGAFEPEVPEEHSFFSETLAKIYLKQKKYDKALAIIKKLNLLYPEKNIYFADQIRFLEKLIINTKKIN